MRSFLPCSNASKSVILHVTFGSERRRVKLPHRLMGLLGEHPDHYSAGLERLATPGALCERRKPMSKPWKLDR